MTSKSMSDLVDGLDNSRSHPLDLTYLIVMTMERLVIFGKVEKWSRQLLMMFQVPSPSECVNVSSWIWEQDYQQSSFVVRETHSGIRS
jgi:hypothetical protein